MKLNQSFGIVESEIKKLDLNFKKNDYARVIERSKNLIKKFPNIVPFYNYLGLSLEQTGRTNEAINIYNKALFYNPNEISILANLGELYRKKGKFEKSRELLLKALNIDENHKYTLYNLGKLTLNLNHYDQAIKYFERLYQIDKKFIDVLPVLSKIYMNLGNFEKAKKYLIITSDTFPMMSVADYSLSNIIDYSKDNSHQKKMIKKMNSPEFKKMDKCSLYFALSKSYEDQKKYNEFSKYINLANHEKNITVKKDLIEIEETRIKNIKLIFKDHNFADEIKEKYNKKKLIFVLGLPRSGTTLIHQILTSHKDVYGAGETAILHNYFLEKTVKENFQFDFFKNNVVNYKSIYNLSLKLSSNYENLEKKKIILDKAPFNFYWIGFIKLLFPEAKIILTNRNIKDNALSIYKNLFGPGKMDWCYTKDNIIRFVKLYKDLIKFWKSKLPGFIYVMNYEDLVKNKEIELEKVINFCCLDWDSKILKFEKKKMPVSSASIFQANQPIYDKSINLNLKYTQFSDFFNKLEKL